MRTIAPKIKQAITCAPSSSIELNRNIEITKKSMSRNLEK